MRTGLCLLAAAFVISNAASAFADPDPEHGKTVFAICSACHSPEEGVNKIGPSLFGIVGRPSASAPGFHYSAGLQAFKQTWTEDLLNQFLQGPQKMVPGTMMFVTIPNDQNRADLIAYLATLK